MRGSTRWCGSTARSLPHDPDGRNLPLEAVPALPGGRGPEASFRVDGAAGRNAHWRADMQGRFGILQQSMVQWNQLHPYTAVHLVRLHGAWDAGRLRDCIRTTLERHGLTHLTLDGARFTFEYAGGGADCEIEVLADDPSPPAALGVEMERQLNRRLDHAGRFSPFRFLIAPAGDAFILGVVYFHPVADAESIVWLLREIGEAYVDPAAGTGTGSFERYPDGRIRLATQHPGVLARKLLALPAQFRSLRRSHRPRYADPGDFHNGFESLALTAAELRSLLQASNSWAVTVNDLLLALLLKALAPGASGRAGAGRRRKLSIGCIVNLRKDLGLEDRPVFGVFLGSFTVSHEVPGGITLRQLALDIREQTALVKRHRLYLGSVLEAGLACRLWRFLSPRHRRMFYAKHHPLWGGITNMNLNRLWKRTDAHVPLDYFRGVSTGPVTPLVLSATTVGDRMNLGLSYRTTVFSRMDVGVLLGRFREHLGETRGVG